jgi:hypothetical protein
LPDNYSPTRTTPHAQKVTAASTADVQTFLAPGYGTAFFINVAGQDVYMTIDGTTPSSTNGLLIPKAGLPVFFPLTVASIKVAPTAATAATVDVLWVSG